MNERLARNGSKLRERSFEYAVVAIDLHREIYKSDPALRDVGLTTIVKRTRENDVIRDASADDYLSILNSQFSIPDAE